MMQESGDELAITEESVMAWLAEQATDCYLVGGSVRDRLLGRPVYDLDFAVEGDSLRLARRLANRFKGAYYALDEQRRTGRAILTGTDGKRLVVDVALYRGDDLHADLADRDFTINALASSVRCPGEVIDLHGGVPDLLARLVRPVSDDSIRHDPIRALRAVRQAAELGFALAPETSSLILRDGGALVGVSGERIRDEVARLLALPQAAPYLRQLDDLGLLTLIFPELEPLRGMAQWFPHYLDGLNHTLTAVASMEGVLAALSGAVPDDPRIEELVIALAPFAGRLLDHVSQPVGEVRPRLVTLKLSALLHDTGKPETRTVEDSGRIRFIGHPRESVWLAADALRRLRLNKAELRLAETIIGHHLRPALLANQEDVTTRAIYRFFRDTGDAGIDVLLHALSDYLACHEPGHPDDGWEVLVALTARLLNDYWDRAAERVSPPRLVSGNDLLREFEMQPGPQIGELLEFVREAQVSGEVSTRAEALALVGSRLSWGEGTQSG